MSLGHNPPASRWLRLYVTGVVVTSPVLMITVALIGRHGHKPAALVTLACIHLTTQAYGALCLWRIYRTSLAFDTVYAEP
jgi:hypothetical protein